MSEWKLVVLLLSLLVLLLLLLFLSQARETAAVRPVGCCVVSALFLRESEERGLVSVPDGVCHIAPLDFAVRIAPCEM